MDQPLDSIIWIEIAASIAQEWNRKNFDAKAGQGMSIE